MDRDDRDHPAPQLLTEEERVVLAHARYSETRDTALDDAVEFERDPHPYEDERHLGGEA